MISFPRLWPIAWYASCCLLLGCRATMTPSVPVQPAPTLAGVASYEDGAPAQGAVVEITSLETHAHIETVVADRAGQFRATLPAGSYALAVTGDRGFGWIEKQDTPSTGFHVVLSKDCHLLSGHVSGYVLPAYVNMSRRSGEDGDTFVSSIGRDGSFALCVPEAYYDVFLTGATVSLPLDINVPATTNVQIAGFANREVRSNPPSTTRLATSLAALVADILARNPAIVGLGEATHGTAEFVATRGELTFRLITNADVQLLLFEIDAINGAALDDYVNGVDVDIAKAVAALGFWVTDTYEFLHFLKSVRDYNATASSKVHIWGIDLQNTVLPMDVLLADPAGLAIDDEAQTALRVAAVKRAKGIRDFSPTQRATLDAVLSRLSVPRGDTRHDLVVAVAARSLAMQLNYWDGDMQGTYFSRRDAGMASLASFLITQLHVRRTCLWAHAGHVTKEFGRPTLGHHLALSKEFGYYSVGFYLYGGSARAWDAGTKIGVISHPIPDGPPFTLEGAIMTATGMPEIAWVPLRGLPTEFQRWLKTPRFVRELGAIYSDADDLMTLRPIRDAFDAVVVLKAGHDSSPTPTGVRKVAHD